MPIVFLVLLAVLYVLLSVCQCVRTLVENPNGYDDNEPVCTMWCILVFILLECQKSQRLDSGAAVKAVSELEWDKTIEFISVV